MSDVPEALRSAAWKEAKRAALDEWARGSADTTQMLRAASRAVDAVLEVAEERLEAVETELRAEKQVPHARRRERMCPYVTDQNGSFWCFQGLGHEGPHDFEQPDPEAAS